MSFGTCCSPKSFANPAWALCGEIDRAGSPRSHVQLLSDVGREAGGIQAEDRHRVTRFFSFTSLSIGAVRVRRGQFRTAELVATAAAAAKHGAKQAGVGLFVRQGESMFAALSN
jgi:hypothetical protein